ncbi:MAG: hypothetical protein FJ115_08590 [Deltaproteobacteria bacterium]|nr:hypothetical protein [Deltaproteobacteria bacterium]MBM4323598.1 hypothetical protein [Deltaproteobacteria bacterium]
MTQAMLSFGVFIFLVFISLWVRFRALRINPGLGIDNWYWLLCIENVKTTHRIPPRLSYFMLEIEEQWYPPLYSFFMSVFSMDVLKKHGGKIAQLTDLLNGFLIFLSILWFSGNVAIAFLSCFSYIMAFFPLSYSHQLQPRGLANFFLTLIMITLWFYIATPSFVTWLGILIPSVLLLFLHKMTAQLWAVYLLGFGLWAKDWTLPTLIPTSMVVAMLLSKGFYLKVLKAHWDIITFWHENINKLGSHQYYESPLYGKKGFISTAVHQKGCRHQIRTLKSIFLNNIFIILLPVWIGFDLSRSRSDFESFLFGWLGLTYLWVFLTTFVPYFRALGAGILYLYQSFLPLFLLIAHMAEGLSVRLQWILYTLWAVGLILSTIQWEKYCRNRADQNRRVFQTGLGEVLDYLKLQPKEGVFCIPFTLPDRVAYWTRKKVFWGGHGFGFHAYLKPYFPVMRENVLQTLTTKPISYVLFWRRYLDSLEDIGLKIGRDLRFLMGKGEYELYEVVKR